MRIHGKICNAKMRNRGKKLNVRRLEETEGATSEDIENADRKQTSEERENIKNEKRIKGECKGMWGEITGMKRCKIRDVRHA